MKTPTPTEAQQKTLKLVEDWLTEYDGAFSSAKIWKRELLKFLTPLLK